MGWARLPPEIVIFVVSPFASRVADSARTVAMAGRLRSRVRIVLLRRDGCLKHNSPRAHASTSSTQVVRRMRSSCLRLVHRVLLSRRPRHLRLIAARNGCPMQHVEYLPAVPSRPPTDLQRFERWATFATATAAIAVGVTRRSIPGYCLAIAAAPLAYRGIAGEWPLIGHGPAGAGTREALAGDRGIHVRESIRLEKSLDEV